MSELKGLRVVVAGAGVVGSVLALHLIRQGAEVILADPAPLGANASGVAAGMLAPVFETLLDGVPADAFPALKASRDAWPELLRSLGREADLDRSGALMQVSQAAGDLMLNQIHALGGQACLIDAAQACTRAPGLSGEGGFLFTPDDWRLDAIPTLTALQAAFIALGGRRLAESALSFENGSVQFDRTHPIAADQVILCTGFGAGSWPGAGGGGLTPIKGQIVRFAGQGPFTGPVVRTAGVYVAPSQAGALAGATMEEGRTDLTIDPGAVEDLRAAAVSLYPHLAGSRPLGYAGVRATTPDGLPLVGATGRRGVLVARGVRRNGWLLAPMIADILVDHLLARSPDAATRAFDPGRFA